MFSRNNNIFVDDLSVTKDNYLIAVLKMLVIFLVINYGTDVSYDYEYIGLFIILLGVVLLKVLNINLLSFKKLKFTHMLYIIFGFLLMYGLDNLYDMFAPPTLNETLIDEEFEDVPYHLALISIAIIPPITEEIICRGLIIRVLFRNHLFLGLIVSSIFFALIHESDTLIGYLPYFYSGLIFGYTYLKTKRLEVPILIHFINNLLAI
ncbi:TPA: CPBP family intramembrane metalloprotease [Staphylococcus aureus]|uniref:CPBP family intramembrane glutamic endopeptidase n=1 Tax=Staphylococcus aureus TaxID=1280 RepID=UPI00024776ED|nr:type II CAAX endopeptidase family protein [Staphylococcus aureus]AMO53993.1 CAAX amino terminal protease family [Staphylococcus aureus subsp. aureus Tager 104]EHO87594.1 CAAX amino terminal protease self- immunity [Staphylococcus aureus subsp. aureus 21262]MBH4578991.1 CPBP family intramembrane metalloprotease [Staphylococcus aureus]MBH4584751.1 CPBP family intramembrane metalloprotease [Staphylococcus aureus]MBH4587346.1 CPBP family intramembrane metalloprotease [Staphylococcus aureus]